MHKAFAGEVDAAASARRLSCIELSITRAPARRYNRPHHAA